MIRNHRLIEDFNLEVDPGMRIAIVGPTGCGKTTFINLLMRFYDVNQGNIKIDGKPIDGLSRHALRSSYGMVLQETWIKDGTVRENIAFGKPDATDEDIIRAAKEAHSWEFIERLPKGLDTVLHEDSISQGQKQLLCITRVMLCLPPMLILDEATSSIDTRTEQQIQEAFDKLEGTYKLYRSTPTFYNPECIPYSRYERRKNHRAGNTRRTAGTRRIL